MDRPDGALRREQLRKRKNLPVKRSLAGQGFILVSSPLVVYFLFSFMIINIQSIPVEIDKLGYYINPELALPSTQIGTTSSVLIELNGKNVSIPPTSAKFIDKEYRFFDSQTFVAVDTQNNLLIIVTVIVSLIISVLVTLWSLQVQRKVMSSEGQNPMMANKLFVGITTFIVAFVTTVSFVLGFVTFFGIKGSSSVLQPNAYSVDYNIPNQTFGGINTNPIEFFGVSSFVFGCFGSWFKYQNAQGAPYYTRIPPFNGFVFTQNVSLTSINDYNSYRSQQCTWFGFSDPCNGKTNCVSYKTQVTASFFDCFGSDKWLIGWVQASFSYSRYRYINLTSLPATINADVCTGSCSTTWTTATSPLLTLTYIFNPILLYPMGVYTNGSHYVDARSIDDPTKVVYSSQLSEREILQQLVIGQSADGSLIIQRLELTKWYLSTPYCLASASTSVSGFDVAFNATLCSPSQFNATMTVQGVYIFSSLITTSCFLLYSQNLTVMEDIEQQTTVYGLVQPGTPLYLSEINGYYVTVASVIPACPTIGWCNSYIVANMTNVVGIKQSRVLRSETLPNVWDFVLGEGEKKIQSAVYGIVAVIIAAMLLAYALYLVFMQKRFARSSSSDFSNQISKLIEMHSSQDKSGQMLQ